MSDKPPAQPPPRSGTESPIPIEATARRMLETAIELHSTNQPLLCAKIEEPVAEVCENARSRGLKAERLIVELKQIWYSVPEPASHEKGEVISRLVTMCILEFYKTHPSKLPG